MLNVKVNLEAFVANTPAVVSLAGIEIDGYKVKPNELLPQAVTAGENIVSLAPSMTAIQALEMYMALQHCDELDNFGPFNQCVCTTTQSATHKHSEWSHAGTCNVLYSILQAWKLLY